MEKLDVNIEEKNTYYPIYISNENIEILRDKLLQEVEGKNYIVIFSQKVHKLYSKILNFPKDKILILKDGETEKNFQNYTKILNFALSRKLTRKDAIIAIGGGVIGDLAGFSASTYMRGIKFIQVPTTLLAATDSSVGGKTAINTKYGKNLVGTFYQPDSVFINVNFIKTLDERQFKSGLGEVVKYGFIEKSQQTELFHKIKELVKETKFNGIFEIEFLIDQNDNFYFLEINFRSSCWTYAYTKCGINLPIMYSQSVIDGKINTSEEHICKLPFKFMNVIPDFKINVKNGNLTFTKWVKDFLDIDCSFYFNKKDIMPFLYFIKNKIFK